MRARHLYGGGVDTLSITLGHYYVLLGGLFSCFVAWQAEELGLAMEAVGEIYGDADMEEMLDVVFRDFCIGK